MTKEELRQKIQTQFAQLDLIIDNVANRKISDDTSYIQYAVKCQLSKAHTELVFAYDMLEDND